VRSRYLLWLGLVAAVATALLLAACGDDAKDEGSASSDAGPAKVRIVRDWPTFWSMQSYYDVGLEKGFFTKQDVEPEFVSPPDAPDIVKLVATGKAEFGIVNTLDLINARLQGLDIVGVAALWPRDMGAICYFKDSGFKTPADLKGEKVAVYQWPQTKLHFKTMLKHYGLSESDVEIVPGGDYTVSLFVAGKVPAGDCAVGGENLDTERETGKKMGFWLYTEHGVPPFHTSILATRPDYLKDNKDVVTRVITAMLDSRDWAAKHPEETVRIAASKHDEVDEKTLGPAWDAITPYLKPYDESAPRGTVDQKVTDAYVKFLRDGDLIDEAPAFDDYIDLSALPGY
jgi:ABC-type nitrate/sulfonate/bicarbonate transport system substrate-binding protein